MQTQCKQKELLLANTNAQFPVTEGACGTRAPDVTCRLRRQKVKGGHSLSSEGQTIPRICSGKPIQPINSLLKRYPQQRCAGSCLPPLTSDALPRKKILQLLHQTASACGPCLRCHGCQTLPAVHAQVWMPHCRSAPTAWLLLLLLRLLRLLTAAPAAAARAW
jgi:hypothetical protein